MYNTNADVLGRIPTSVETKERQVLIQPHEGEIVKRLEHCIITQTRTREQQEQLEETEKCVDYDQGVIVI